MSRAAVFSTIVAATGLPESNVFVNYEEQGRPSGLDPAYDAFVVIRWQESTQFSQTYTGMSNGIPRAPRVLEVWTHYPREESDDFSLVDEIQDKIEMALLGMEHVEGGDGYTVTCVNFSGRSRDTFDPGFRTICRTSGFTVLYRKTA